jgi:hypothetical protein
VFTLLLTTQDLLKCSTNGRILIIAGLVMGTVGHEQHGRFRLGDVNTRISGITRSKVVVGVEVR